MASESSYNIEWAARELNVSIAEVENLVRAGKLRKKVVGSRRFVPAADIQAVLKSRNEAPSNSSYDETRERAEISENQPGKEIQQKAEVPKLAQQYEVTSQTVSRNDRSLYCPVDDASKRLEKSIGQVKQLILEEKLGSAVFCGERMVLIQDIDRLAQTYSAKESREKSLTPQNKVQTQEQTQQQEATPHPVSENRKEEYCTYMAAAQRLDEPINQIKRFIDNGELEFALFGYQRMVLISDVERLASSTGQSWKDERDSQSNAQKGEHSREPQHPGLDKEQYCAIMVAAQRLNKSINQTKEMIEAGRLNSELFGAQRMVLIEDVDRLVRTSYSDESRQKSVSLRSKAHIQHQMQQSEVPRQPVYGSDKSHYCSKGDAAKRLEKSIEQVVSLIRDEKLHSAVFDGERVVLRQDVELLLKKMQDSVWENENDSTESEIEYYESQEAASLVEELEEDLESVQNQLASERALWRGQVEEERKERQQLNSEAQEKISSLRKEAYAIQKDLEQERDKRKKVDEDAQIEIDTLDTEAKAIKDELEQERADRLGAQWEVQELKVQLEEARVENTPLKSLWGRFKSVDGRANVDVGHESSQTPDSQAEEHLEILRSELQKEKQRREESENWVKDLQSELQSLQLELDKERAHIRSLEDSLQVAKEEHEEYVQKLLNSKEQAVAQAGELAREFEGEKNLLDEIRRILDSQPASEMSDTPTTAEDTDGEDQGYLLNTPDGQHTFSSPFPLEDDDLELLQLIARYGELTADQIRTQNGRRRAVGDLDDLLDKLDEQGVNVIEVSEDRYRLDVTQLQSD